MSIQAVQKAYSAKFGTKSLALPPNEGLSRLIWALPLLGIVLGAALIVVVARRWVRQGAAAQKVKAPLEANAPRDDYDDKLDRELSDLDRE